MIETLQLTVNGTTHPVHADPQKTLLDVLREDLDLTGSKYGCGEGKCGACMVLIDGAPTSTCILPVADAVGKQVTTVEGLANGRLHPLQEAFLETGALQCGYCTPGMIISGVALLNANPNPTTEEIVHAMQDHICRCGVYSRIVAAIQMAAARLQEVSHG